METKAQITLLRAARSAAGWPQDRMARHIGISPSLYADLENGRLIPTERVARLIERAFDVPAAKMLRPARGRAVPKLVLGPSE